MPSSADVPRLGPHLAATPPLIHAKIHPPAIPSRRVLRPRLYALLDRGAGGPLTALIAPAGYGKTTLAADWAGLREQRGDLVAWYRAEADDDDPAVFSAYLAGAVQEVTAGR